MEITNFISPKQLIEIKNEIVEQALARANPIVALEYADGIFFLAENPSNTLNKITEIYDRIVFAGTGVYNDYEKLRKHGVQFADIKGFTYSREDVRAISIASDYSTILGDIFSHQHLPVEVEILVAELGETATENRMYRIPFSGGLIEERMFSVIGDIFRDSETGKIKRNSIGQFLKERGIDGHQDLRTAFKLAKEALQKLKKEGESLVAENLEAVILDRTKAQQRKMARLGPDKLKEWMQDQA